MDPCLGFYLPSSPSSDPAFTSSSPLRVAQTNPPSETQDDTTVKSLQIEEERVPEDAGPPQTAITVEAFLRRNVRPKHRKQRHVNLGNNPCSPFDPDETHALNLSKIQSSSSPPSRVSAGGVKKSKAPRSTRKKTRLFSDRLLRAAVLSHVDVHTDFQTEAERLLPPPLEFLIAPMSPTVRKPQRWKLVDPKKEETPFRREFSIRRQGSHDAEEVVSAPYRPVTRWKPLVESSHEVAAAPSRAPSNRVLRVLNQARYPPLQFLSMVDETPADLKTKT